GNAASYTEGKERSTPTGTFAEDAAANWCCTKCMLNRAGNNGHGASSKQALKINFKTGLTPSCPVIIMLRVDKMLLVIPQ
ncbi:MAG: hypothetical protein KZY51_00700, partial [Staphylococcaceae bacterium]|nr:hypothetical protein [Staphylococcaceae bacterium]